MKANISAGLGYISLRIRPVKAHLRNQWELNCTMKSGKLAEQIEKESPFEIYFNPLPIP